MYVTAPDRRLLKTLLPKCSEELHPYHICNHLKHISDDLDVGLPHMIHRGSLGIIGILVGVLARVISLSFTQYLGLFSTHLTLLVQPPRAWDTQSSTLAYGHTPTRHVLNPTR